MAIQHTNGIDIIKKILESLGLKCLKESSIFSDDKWRKLDIECIDSNGNKLAIELDSNCQTGGAQCVVNVRKLDNFRNKENGTLTCHADVRSGKVHCQKNDKTKYGQSNH